MKNENPKKKNLKNANAEILAETGLSESVRFPTRSQIGTASPSLQRVTIVRNAGLNAFRRIKKS